MKRKTTTREGEIKGKTESAQNITLIKVETKLLQAVQPKVVKLHNLRTNLVVEMGFKAANALSKKFPKEYKLA